MLKKLFFIFFITLSNLTLGYSNDNPDQIESVVISEILANEIECIKSYENDKLYLKSERIIATDQGLFINLNGKDFARLPFLHSDVKGCYLPLSSHVIIEKNICKACGREYLIKCMNPDCPSNKKPR